MALGNLRALKRVLRYIDCQSDHRAPSKVDDGVDGDHFQIQHDVSWSLNWTGHHHSGADWPGLPHVELSAFIPRLDLEDVVGSRVTSCGLHLEDV